MKKMKKMIGYGLAVTFLSLLLAFPSLAETRLKASGWTGTKTVRSTRATGGSQYVTNDIDSQNYTHARTRLRFEINPSENTGFVWYNEIDYDFGRSAYVTGRGSGGGLGSDTTNLETKNLYFFFDVPENPLKVTIGIQGVGDNFGLMLIGNDTAGITLDYGLENTTLKFGAYRFWDPSYNNVSDSVDYFMFSATRQFSPATKLGFAAHYLGDGGNDGQGSLNLGPSADNGWASTSNNPATGNKELIPNGTDYSMDSFFLGLFGEHNFSDGTTLSGFGIYNFGSVDVSGSDDIDINGFALELRASKTINKFNFTLGSLFVSGSDEDADQEFGFTNTGLYSSGSSFYYRHGLMIMLPDGGDWQNSSALIYNNSNIYEDRFLGVTGLFANVKFPITEKLKVKVTGGAMWSAEKRVVNGNSYIGTEVNGKLTYSILQNTSVSFNAAYAFTGDFYEVSDAQAAASTKGLAANTDFDNVYYSYIQFKIKF